MPSSNPPPSSSQQKTKHIDWAALGSALAAIVIGLSAYIKAKTEPQAQGAYETLVTQVIKMQETIDKNHDDLEKLSGYIASAHQEQEDKIKAIADAMDQAVEALPQAPAPAASASAKVARAAAKKARAKASASATPPPPAVAPAPPSPNRSVLDQAFKDTTRARESGF